MAEYFLTSKGDIPMLDPSGKKILLPEKEAFKKFKEGWKPDITAETAKAHGHRPLDYDPRDAPVLAATMGAFRGATAGLSDVAIRGVMGQEAGEGLGTLTEANPWSSFGGEMAGVIGGTLVGGPAGGLGKLGGAVPAAGISRLGARASTALGGGFKGALARGAVEGGLFGAGMTAGHIAQTPGDIDWSAVPAELAKGTFYSAAVGAPIGGVGHVLGGLARFARGKADTLSSKYGALSREANDANDKVLGLLGKQQEALDAGSRLGVKAPTWGTKDQNGFNTASKARERIEKGIAADLSTRDSHVQRVEVLGLIKEMSRHEGAVVPWGKQQKLALGKAELAARKTATAADDFWKKNAEGDLIYPPPRDANGRILPYKRRENRVIKDPRKATAFDDLLNRKQQAEFKVEQLRELRLKSRQMAWTPQMEKELSGLPKEIQVLDGKISKAEVTYASTLDSMQVLSEKKALSMRPHFDAKQVSALAKAEKLAESTRAAMTSVEESGGSQLFTRLAEGKVQAVLGGAGGAALGGWGGSVIGAIAAPAVVKAIRRFLVPKWAGKSLHEAAEGAAKMSKRVESATTMGRRAARGAIVGGVSVMTDKEYQEVSDQLERTTPAQVELKMAAAAPPGTNEMDIKVAARLESERQEYVRSIMPRVMTTGLLTRSIDPGVEARRKLTNGVRAAYDPESVPRDFSRGRLTKEGLDAFAALMPMEYEVLKEAVLETVEDFSRRGGVYSTQKQQQISLLTGQPTMIAGLPALAPEEPPEGSGGPQGGGGGGKSQKAPKGIDKAHLTNLEQHLNIDKG